MLENHNHTETKTKIELKFNIFSFHLNSQILWQTYWWTGSAWLRFIQVVLMSNAKFFNIIFQLSVFWRKRMNFQLKSKYRMTQTSKVTWQTLPNACNYHSCSYRSFCQSDCIGVRWLWNLQFNCHNSECRLKFD